MSSITVPTSRLLLNLRLARSFIDSNDVGIVPWIYSQRIGRVNRQHENVSHDSPCCCEYEKLSFLLSFPHHLRSFQWSGYNPNEPLPHLLSRHRMFHTHFFYHRSKAWYLKKPWVHCKTLRKWVSLYTLLMRHNFTVVSVLIEFGLQSRCLIIAEIGGQPSIPCRWAMKWTCKIMWTCEIRLNVNSHRTWLWNNGACWMTTKVFPDQPA